ncbi:MAG: alpha/beta hydrolase [Sporichthyaceae bacterium]
MKPRLPAPVLKAAMPLVRRAVLHPSTPLGVRRISADLIVGTVPWPRGTRVRWGTLGGVRALRIDPTAAGEGRSRPDTAPDPRNGAILYLHGGGYVVGSPRSHRPVASRLALGTGLPVLVLDYRMAPEHPHPAAIEDADSAWKALRAGGTPANRIVLAGDSAGAGLSLALAQRLKTRGEQPRCLALSMPFVDLTAKAGWRDEPPGRDPLLNPHDIAAFGELYAPDSAEDPAVSPVHTDLSGLPPMIVHTAGLDSLRPDGLALVEAARAAGVVVDHTDYPGFWHVFHLLAGYIAAGDECVADLVASINATP